MSIYLRDPRFTGSYIDNVAADKTKGDVELIKDGYGFWFNDVDVSVDDKATFVIQAEGATADKKTGTGEEIYAGDKVYGDPADSYKVSATKGAGFLYLGTAHEDATASDTTVYIKFDGTLYTLL